MSEAFSNFLLPLLGLPVVHAPVLTSKVPSRYDLPSGLAQHLDSGQEALRRLRQAGGSLTTTIAASVEQNRQAEYLSFWRENAPLVELRSRDNPGVAAAALTLPWVSSGKRAPLVLVRVTPKVKPMPERGFLQDMPWLAPLVSAIPIVGAVLGPVLAISSGLQAKHYAGSWSVPQSAFEPQYKPVPFFAELPLDLAQMVVREPWFAPVIINEFNDQMAQYQRYLFLQYYG